MRARGPGGRVIAHVAPCGSLLLLLWDLLECPPAQKGGVYVCGGGGRGGVLIWTAAYKGLGQDHQLFFPSESSQNLNSGPQRGQLAKPPTVIISATSTSGRSSGNRKKSSEKRTSLQHSPKSKPSCPQNSKMSPLRDTCLLVCLHPLVSYFYPKPENRTKDTESKGTFLPYFSSIQN